MEETVASESLKVEERMRAEGVQALNSGVRGASDASLKVLNL